MHSDELTDKTEWNDFVKKYGPRSGAFLHSFEWGEFQKATGAKVSCRGVVDNGNILLVAMLIEKKASFFGRYLYCPRGPVSYGQFDLHLISDLVEPWRRSALFFRFDFPSETGDVHKMVSLKKTVSVQPADTLLLDLTKSEDDLLEAMHQKTRYNIRLAERKGVRVEIEKDVLIDDVWRLFSETSSRGEFRLHKKEYYEKMLSLLSSGDCHVFLASAYYEDHLVAANIMIDFNGTRTYLHGASGNRHRNVMAPFLLHWELIRDAKEKGLGMYDWWGVAPEGAADNHPWSGISRFKRGFGGEEVSYAGTFDYILRPFRYRLYSIARRIRRGL